MQSMLLVIGLATQVSPVEKTVELLANLQAKVVQDGEAAQKAYEEFKEYCDDQSHSLQYAIKTSGSDVERAAATGFKQSALAEAASAEISELAGSISSNAADLGSATAIRAKEASDHAAADADLTETIGMLRRAHGIVQKEMGGALLQGGVQLTDALKAIVTASSVNGATKTQVQALLQQSADADDWLAQPTGAPDAAAYESHSSGILSVLEDLLDEAEEQRASAQKTEATAKHNFQMLAQKLNDQIKHEGADKARATKNKAAAEQAAATAEGEHANAVKARDEGDKMLADLQQDCMMQATAFDTEQKGRSEELSVLTSAKAVLEEKAGGAAARTYSFLQVSSKTLQTRSVVALVQQLARDQHAPELAQLAQRLEGNPFGKVKGLISEMLEKLVADAAAEASHKAFCDKELAETAAKRDDKQDEVDGLSTKIDIADAKMAKLKEDVATLNAQLNQLAKAQAEATAARAAGKAAYAAAKADYDSGLEGVGLALQVLRDYYAASDDSVELLQARKHNKASGDASGIIGLLEVIESDFSRDLTQAVAAEDESQREYDTMTQETKVATATKRTAVAYKEKDGKQTAALHAGFQDDRGTAQTELAAILEYWDKLQPICIAKAEPYAERKKRREAEIAGLKQALEILESESATSFLQVRS